MRLSRRNIAILLLTTTLFSGVSRSSSADPKPAIKDGKADSPTTSKLPEWLEGKVSVLKKGQRAPIRGILLTRATLALLMKESEKRIRTAVASTQLAVKNATARVFAAEKRAAVEVEAAKSRTEACLADALRRERIYETALAKGSPAPSFWRSPLFVGTIGVIVGGGICAGAAAVSR